jgi:predicted NBD/HSP70 family sugar kinase
MLECTPSKANNIEAMRVLQVIKRNNGMTRQQLAECLECSPAKISLLLRALEDMGLILEGESMDTGSRRRVRQIVIGGGPATFIGVELGSYEIRTALVDFGGNVLARDKVPEDSGINDPARVMERVFALVDGFIAKNPEASRNLRGIALALSGVVNYVDGTAMYFRNQKVWEGVPLKKIIEERYGMTCFMDDSSRAMAAAEKRWGCCRGNDNFVLLSLGFGLGASVFIRGGIYRGAGYASEIGHMVIDPAGPRCNCGSHGCLESFVSGYALENRVRKAIDEGVYTSLSKLETVTAKEIIDAAAMGEKFAFGAVTEMAEKLGVGVANVINIFHPECVVLAGGLSKAGELLTGPIRQIVRSTALSTHANGCEIIVSPLDEYSAAMGMADIMTGWALESAPRIKRITGIVI